MPRKKWHLVLSLYVGYGVAQVCSLAGCVSVSPLVTQQKEGNSLSYRELIDQNFPATTSLLAEHRFVLLLRFLPSAKPESQIEIVYGLNGVGTIAMRKLSASLSAAVAKSTMLTKRDYAADLASIRSLCRSSDSSSAALEWLAGFWRAVEKSSKELSNEANAWRPEVGRIALDASVYEIYYDDGFRSMQFKIDAGTLEMAPGKMLALVKWMESVNDEVVQMFTTSPE